MIPSQPGLPVICMSEADTQSTPTLNANALHLWRGEHHLLRDVSFSLAAGELLQVTGPNGVGKTSLLRVVAGLMPAESGTVLWGQISIERDATAYQDELAYLGHANALKTDLTALENLQFSNGLRQTVDNDSCLQALHTLGVAHCASLPVKVLSAGQRRRVALARVLLCDAILWILDEPITNLDAAGIELVEGLMAQHLARGGMILTAAHQALLVSHTGTRNLGLH